MSSYVVWLDHHHAKLFKLAPEKLEKSEVKGHETHHHTNHQDAEKHKNTEKFFHDLAQKLNTADHVLLVGPGLAKNHFKTYCENHHQDKLAKKIIGLEPIDTDVDSQIEKKAHEFFKKYNLFH